MTRRDGETFDLVTVHSLTWLAVANTVGLWLATLLVWPRLGDLVAPFTYGRFMPLHLDLHLYGWCSLPLVGLLLKLYRPSPGLSRLALGLWSGALLFGAVSWLAGDVGGKLFLDWSGAARAVFALALAFLAVAIGAGLVAEVRRGGSKRWVLVAKGTFLAVLAAVPAVLYLAADPRVYPSINPDSGGATGGSLLGSTLGMVVIIYLVPFMLGLRPAGDGRLTAAVAFLLALHFAVFGLMEHGDRSHHELAQIAGLASLVVWWGLLAVHLRRFPWPKASRPWLVALGGWAVLLLATGLTNFMPGVLERLKFTNALVAHAHVAMAGMVTSLDVVILIALGGRAARVFADRRVFFLFQSGAVVLVMSLLALGMIEGRHPGLLYRGEPISTALYAARWLGGAAMALASFAWLRTALVGRAVPADSADSLLVPEKTHA